MQALLMLADQAPRQLGWPDAVAILGLCACFATIAWCASRDSGDDGVTIWFRPPEPRFEHSWKGKDQGLAPGEVCPAPPPPPTKTNDTTATP